MYMQPLSDQALDAITKLADLNVDKKKKRKDKKKKKDPTKAEAAIEAELTKGKKKKDVVLPKVTASKLIKKASKKKLKQTSTVVDRDA
jgi:hypothetical protein